MTSTSRFAPLALAALVSSAALPVFAQDGQAVYRAQVLGERVAVATASGSAVSEQALVPGSQGRYLVHLGRSTERAIAEARAAGEEPVWAARPVAHTVAVDGFEAYQRYLGRAARSPAAAVTDVAQHAAPTLR
ncbi:MAG: hypothetical protein QM722_15345 [Piscinibacter sp.]